MTAGAPSRIVLDGLCKTYGGRNQQVPAVEDVSFEVRQGEFVALIGPSGCGKSTILNMIAGLIPHSGGSIRIDGNDVRYGEPTPKVGYVFQRDTVYPWRTVRRNIGLGLEIARRPRAEREAEVARMIARAGLEGFENNVPITLSGGMRQRVSLMRTLIMRPEILLMDEPFGALDAQTRSLMQTELLAIWRRSPKTVIFVTHDVHEAVYLAGRVVVMSARPGRVKAVIETRFDRSDPGMAKSKPFLDKVDEIWGLVRDEALKAQGTRAP